MNPDQYLSTLLDDAKRLDQRNPDVERFIAKLEKFIASAPPTDKQAAVRDRRFVTDRNSPPPGMFGFTSFWQCEWHYNAQGQLSVSVEYVT